MPHSKAGYMGALFFLSNSKFCLAMSGGPYMTPFDSTPFDSSQGYNAEQEVGLVIPVEKGSLVALISRASSDGVAGFGSSAKRFIGKRLMGHDMINFYKAMQKKDAGK
jgi:hypothetical protein